MDTRNAILKFYIIKDISKNYFFGNISSGFKYYFTPVEFFISPFVMFWPADPAKNAIQGDAPEGSDTF